MQPPFSEALSAILECIDRLGNSSDLPAQLQAELQTMRSLSAELAIYHGETASEVRRLSQQLAQFSRSGGDRNAADHLQQNLQSEDEVYILLVLIFARLKQSIDLEELLDMVAFEVFQILQVDQVIVVPLDDQLNAQGYQMDGQDTQAFSAEAIANALNDDQQLQVRYEFVKTPARSMLQQPVPALYLSSEWLGICQQNVSYAIDDVNTADPQVSAALKPLGIEAAIAIAIPKGRETWGLILIHQYEQPRHWQAWEIDLLEKLATQLAILIHQMQLLAKSEFIRRERDQVLAKLRHNQLHDSLTGLPNRNAFMNSLEATFQKSQTDLSHTFTVFFIDCDRQQSVNENFGMEIGDQLLQAVSQRLRDYHHPHFPIATVARIDSDEFAMLIENLANPDEALAIGAQILHSLKQPFLLSQQQIFSSASIGIAISDREYTYSNEILRDACLAMHQSRKTGRGKQAIFIRQADQGAKSTVQLENDLRQALTNQELYLVYQPIISIHHHQVMGFEVLLRWMHPLQGLISPQEFLPIAEETGEIVAIGEWVLDQACQQLSLWQTLAQNRLQITLSINISTLQVTQPNFVERISQIIRDRQISPHSIKLEVTESVFMQNIDISAQKLAELRELGIQIYIDDFGTGYSSFSYLQTLPIDVLKIDRSFTNKIVSDIKSKRIIQAILRLANNLGMGIVVEGIETAEELDYFENVGGSSIGVQGYLISHPLDSQKATLWLEQQLEAKPQL